MKREELVRKGMTCHLMLIHEDGISFSQISNINMTSCIFYFNSLQYRVIELISRNIVPISISYCTSLRVHHDILRGTLVLTISALTLL